MKGKIEFLMKRNDSGDNIPFVRLDGCSDGVEVSLFGDRATLFNETKELKRLGDDMFYISIPSSKKVFIIDQRGNCKSVGLFTADVEITTTADGFIKIENPKGNFRYIDRLFRESTQPTELGKALYQYDRENIKPEDVIDAYFKEAYKDDPAGVIKNKVMEFILNEEKARAFREIAWMEDVPDEYVKGLESKIAGIEAHLTLKQERLQKKEAAKKAVSSISFGSNFLTKY